MADGNFLFLLGKVCSAAFGCAYQRLDVSNIDNPHLLRSPFVRHVHLLPGMLKLYRVDPLVVSWVTDIVEVVVDTGAAWPVGLIANR